MKFAQNRMTLPTSP